MSGILQTLIYGVSVVKDAYFNLVTLLLNTTTTNGAQNNTFLDSSTNNFTITRNGNTTQGTFTPFSQTGWGNYFNGSTDYLTTNSSTALNLGANDFSAECWFYTTSTAATQTIISGVNATVGSGSWLLQINNTGQLRFFCLYNGGISLDYNVGTGTVSTNIWNHFAVTRNGANLRIFLNGTQVGTTNTTLAALSIDNASGNYTIGQVVEIRAGWYFAGYISNLRVVIGTALYTSNFTPSTTPLTAVTNTALLTCQSNRFIDNSTNALTLTPSGTPSVQAFSPFAPTTAYDTAVVGGSGYFDGSGDNLTWSGTAIGSGSYTVECWFYATSYTTYTTIIGALSGGTNAFALYINSATQIQVDHINVGNVTFTVSSMSLNSWNHLAVTRSSNNLTVFVNGVRSSTGVVSNSSNYSNNSVSIGYSAGATYFPGYISNLRIVTGSAVYNPSSSTITVPTAPLTAITNTQLLTNFTNAGIYDSAAKNDLETVGNAQVSTTQAKWGSNSIAFDGSGDYLDMCGNNQNYYFYTGAFTIEFWAYFNSTSNCVLYEGRPGTNGAYIRIDYYSNSLRLYANSGVQITGSSVSTGQWYHIALCRSGTSTKLFLDGTQTGSTYTDSTSYLSGNNRPRIGDGDGGGEGFNGYIDDLRITKGYARYTANFTPPSSAFPIQ